MDTVDLAGWRTGKLQVVRRATNSERGAVQWLCQCACGHYRVVRADKLLQGKVKRCALCADTELPGYRVEVWAYPLLDLARAPVEGQAGFARIWRDGVEVAPPVWLSYVPRTRANAALPVLAETVRRHAVAGAIGCQPDPAAITAWVRRHHAATLCHLYRDGHEVWAAWLALTGQWRGPAHLLPELDGAELSLSR